MTAPRLVVVGSPAWYDQLEQLANSGDDITRLAVWAARAADCNGNAESAQAWHARAAERAGTLF